MTNSTTITTNLIANSDTQYLAQVAFNFAERFGIFSFFILILVGSLITFGGGFLWYKFIKKNASAQSFNVEDLKFYFKTLQNPTLEK